MEFKLIDHGSELYSEMIRLRKNVLLDPIGIPQEYIDKEKEKNDYLIGAFRSDRLIGCCVLTPKPNGIIQLRQMAVVTDQQGKNIGRLIIQFAEQTATEEGFSQMVLHSRDNVLRFYSKCGYETDGEQFYEVGIPHHRMKKDLTKPV